MAGYSIGDRVEVLWNDGPYDATVIKVYSGGAVDVTHDANKSLGVFLTAKEHGLKLLPEKQKQKVVAGRGKKKVCSVDDCSKNASSGGLCSVHRPKKLCSVEG